MSIFHYSSDNRVIMESFEGRDFLFNSLNCRSIIFCIKIFQFLEVLDAALVSPISISIATLSNSFPVFLSACLFVFLSVSVSVRLYLSLSLSPSFSSLTDFSLSLSPFLITLSTCISYFLKRAIFHAFFLLVICYNYFA